ncbi:MAG: hypothetical protein KGJ41_02420 [Rhodospirillales bacterium]|nr:hypothetical protein [Rhodospirillales bacterium]MDE2197850.1 hypothetical protein [Rhodospirillales bacterium]MDE2577162.1 hypothetical protein [Rhodospirillales bacterium]
MRQCAALVAAAGFLLLAGCAAPPTVTSGAFRNVAAIGTSLHRGSSTKTDVRALLGVPNGDGMSAFRNVAGGPREVWYYEDIEMTGAKFSGSIMTMAMRQQWLLVFFKGDTFDGYLWTTNSAPVRAN